MSGTKKHACSTPKWTRSRSLQTKTTTKLGHFSICESNFSHCIWLSTFCSFRRASSKLLLLLGPKAMNVCAHIHFEQKKNSLAKCFCSEERRRFCKPSKLSWGLTRPRIDQFAALHCTTRTICNLERRTRKMLIFFTFFASHTNEQQFFLLLVHFLVIYCYQDYHSRYTLAHFPRASSWK